MITNEIIKIIKYMPHCVYSNEYYRDNHYINDIGYCSWNYDTKSKYCSDYQIKLFERDDRISIYLFRMDKVLPVKRGPKVIINSLQNIADYFRIIGFKVETLYDHRWRKPAFPEISQTIPRHKEYLEAIEKVITYLEILGFRNDH